MSEREVIVVVKNWRDTALHDIASIATFVAFIGIGVLLQSTAMQWAGALLWFIWVLGFASALAKKNRMTIPEARKRLDEIEASLPTHQGE